MSKRILSMLLAVFMLLALMPMAALAADEELTEETIEEVTEESVEEAAGESTEETAEEATVPLDGESYGTCGDDLAWSLEDGTLTISGGGAMTDYTAANPAPWYAERESITTVLIESGVENIGSYAFAGCSSLDSVSIPLSVESIGEQAFLNCQSLVNVEYDGTQTQWDKLTSGITKGSGNEALVEANVQCSGGVITEIKAVTGDVTVSDGEVIATGTFTMPYSEEEYAYTYGIEWGVAPYECIDWAMQFSSLEHDAQVLAFNLTENLWGSVMVPDVTYYYWAVLYYGEGECVRGEARTFKAPECTFESLEVGQSETSAFTAQYGYKPKADGMYKLALSGDGYIAVYDSTGAIVKKGYTNIIFTAKADQTYYIGVANYSGSEDTLTLTEFVPTVTEVKAVTGDVTVSDGEVIATGCFTMPYSEEDYTGYGDAYVYGFEWGVEEYVGIGSRLWGGSNEQDGESLNMSLTDDLGSVVMVPDANYYCWAVIDYTGGFVTGEAKAFTAPERTFETISVDQSKTLDTWAWKQYSFTPEADGMYKLSLTGDGYIAVYDSTGAQVKSGNSKVTITATAEQTYYVGAQNYIEGENTLTLETFIPTVTTYKAVTGEYEIGTDGTVTVYGYYTFPFSEDGHDMDIAVGTKDEPFYYGGAGRTSCEELDNEKVAFDLGWVLLVPGVTYYYRAYTYNDDVEMLMGEAMTFEAPKREYDELVAGRSETLVSYAGRRYCFKPTEDGTYQWEANGAGSAIVYDSAGKIVWASELLSIDEETGAPTWELDRGSFEAKAGKTYYVRIDNDDNAALTVSLKKTGTSSTGTTSGTCGENLTWKLEDGTLTISGTGKMTNFGSTDAPVPWESSCESIRYLVIGDGVTTIGVQAFAGCSALENVTIPASVTTIERSAFVMCQGLKSITIPVSVTSIGNYAFSQCTALTDVYYAGTKAQWDAIKIGSGNYPLTGATLHAATVADVLGDIDGDATADKIRDAVQGLGADALADALTGEGSAEVLRKLNELENKTNTDVNVTVSEDAGLSSVSIVGAALNTLAEGATDITLTINAASESQTLPSGLSDENVVYIDITLSGVKDAETLAVPVVLTFAVPTGMDAQKLRLVHYTDDGAEVLEPVQVIEGEGGVCRASFVVGGFSPFALAQLAYTPGDIDGDGDVSIMDVLALLKYVAGISDNIVYGDVDNDGAVTIMDVLHLLKYVAGIISAEEIH